MLKLFKATILLLLVTSTVAYAYDSPMGDKEKEKEKEYRHPKPYCFDLYCVYHKKAKDSDGFEKCKVGATFKKSVAENGYELDDEASRAIDAKFQVECDGKVTFNNGATVYSSFYGSRIQALPGPFPSLTLPNAALHEGHFFSVSFLQLENQTLPGQCFISTKLPKND